MAAREEDEASNTDSSGDFEDWGSEQEDAPIRSLLTTEVLSSLSEVLSELKRETGFDFDGFAAAQALGTYDRLKLANYIRHTQLTAASKVLAGDAAAAAAVLSAVKAAVAAAAVSAPAAEWREERWLQPVMEDDGLIMGVLSAFDEDDEAEAAAPASASGAGAGAICGPASGDEDEASGQLGEDVRDALLSASLLAKAGGLRAGGAGAGAGAGADWNAAFEGEDVDGEGSLSDEDAGANDDDVDALLKDPASLAAAAAAHSARAAALAEAAAAAQARADASKSAGLGGKGGSRDATAARAVAAATAAAGAAARAVAGQRQGQARGGAQSEKDEEIAALRAQIASLRATLARHTGVGADGDDENAAAGAGAGAGASAAGGSGSDSDTDSEGKQRRILLPAEQPRPFGPDGKPKRKLSDAEDGDAAATATASTPAGGAGAAGAAGAGKSKKSSGGSRHGAGKKRVGSGPFGGDFSGVLGQDNDSYYFDSYAQLGIHHDMLSDAVRTEGYRDAIRALVPKGKPEAAAGSEPAPAPAAASAPPSGPVVLDVGCGTGVLSFFSARAGASRVIAVDASDILHDARTIAAANGLDKAVTFLRGKAEQVDVPGAAGVPTSAAAAAAAAAASGVAADASAGTDVAGAPRTPCVDVLVSEWMGYALLYECMLSSVLVCRDRYLKPGGLMLPSKADILIAGVTDHGMWGRRVTFWDDVHGLDMRCMKRHLHAAGEPFVEVLPASAISTDAQPIRRFNLLTMKDADQDIVGAPFTLRLKKPGADAGAAAAAGGAAASTAAPVLHGLCLWFDIDFDDERFNPAAAGLLKDAAAGAAEAPAKLPAAWQAGGDDDEVPELEESPAAAAAATPATAAASASASTASSKPTSAVFFSTGPHVTPTHWAQTFFLFEKPLPFPEAGDGSLQGSMTMTRDPVNPRQFRFAITLRDGATGASLLQQSYHMH